MGGVSPRRTQMSEIEQTEQQLEEQIEEQIEEQKLPHHTEFETKYRVEGDKIYAFKEIINNLEDKPTFLYVEGPDFYYTKNDSDDIERVSFMRWRKADNQKRAEVTFKKKPEGVKSNTNRKEVNWRVDRTPFKTIEEGAFMQGYDFNFKISKMCHIYNFKDATLVFYTVRGEDNKDAHFVEIEVDEETIHKLTEKDAWDVIKKYEEILAPLGITYRNRMMKSLFELYVKDLYNEGNKETI